MTDREYIDILQSSINFYKKSLDDYQRALDCLKPSNPYYEMIIDRMLYESDLIDSYNRILNNKKQ